MPKKAITEEEDIDVKTEIPIVKLTKKGQKPRQFTEEHLEKLKIAREKARVTQLNNKELRLMEKENKADEERKRKEGIIAKNKEIKTSLKKVPNKPSSKPSVLEKVKTKDDDERLERTANANNASVVGEDYVEDDYLEQNIKVIKKEKTKKKPKKPIVIVEQSESSESDEEQQVVYVKKKSNRYKKVNLQPPMPIAPEPILQPETVRETYRPTNPFHNIYYKKF